MPTVEDGRGRGEDPAVSKVADGGDVDEAGPKKNVVDGENGAVVEHDASVADEGCNETTEASGEQDVENNHFGDHSDGCELPETEIGDEADEDQE